MPVKTTRNRFITTIVCAVMLALVLPTSYALAIVVQPTPQQPADKKTEELKKEREAAELKRKEAQAVIESDATEPEKLRAEASRIEAEATLKNINEEQAKPANTAKPEDSGLDLIGKECGIWNLKICFAYLIAQIYYGLLWIVSWVLWAVSQLFNIALDVQNKAFSNQPIVNVGWKIARDVANIFYIFFLLIIAIATIIRYESYGMKALLRNLIISALFVNFSLPIAGVIIDFSNALGNQFYISMATNDGSGALDISTKIISGFEPQKLFAKPTQESIEKDLFNVLLNIIISASMGIVLILVVSVVLFAAIMLLLKRIIALWFVLILSPLAFLFWVLPKTSNMSSEWFEALFKNSFFYPAFMFTLYIGVTAIERGVISDMLSASYDLSDSPGGAVTFFTENITLILGFVMLAMFLSAGFLVAQKMSVAGAGAAMATGKYFKGKGTAMAKSVGARTGGNLADRALDSKLGAFMSRIPIARQALRPVADLAQKGKKERDDRATKDAALAKNLSPTASAAMMRTMSAQGKAKAFSSMDEKQKAQTVQSMSAQDQIAFSSSIHATDPNKNYAREVAIASGSIEQAMKILHGENPPADANSAEGIKYQADVNKYIKSLSEKDLEKQRAESINDVHTQRAMITNGTDIGKLADSSNLTDPAAREALSKLADEINSVTGAIKIMHGADKPPADATNAAKDKYREQTEDYVANLSEKGFANMNTKAAENKYVSEAVLKTASPTDMRRLAGTTRGAQTLQTMIGRAAATHGSSKEYEDLSEKEREDNTTIFNNKKALKDLIGDAGTLNWINSSAGQGVVKHGRRVTRRDVPTGPPATPPATGTPIPAGPITTP